MGRVASLRSRVRPGRTLTGTSAPCEGPSPPSPPEEAAESHLPQPRQHLPCGEFSTAATLTPVRWCLAVVSPCVSPMIRGVGRRSICLLAICMSALEDQLFVCVTYFLMYFRFFSEPRSRVH